MAKVDVRATRKQVATHSLHLLGITSINNPPLHKGIENCKVLETVHTDVVEGDYQKICHVLENFIEQYFG